eukprot:1160033-Pelagomonas_calceolata.AAC.11
MVQAHSGSSTLWLKHTLAQAHSGPSTLWLKHTLAQALGERLDLVKGTNNASAEGTSARLDVSAQRIRALKPGQQVRQQFGKLDLERKLRALLTKEKEKAEEEAALAMGLCTGSAMLP